MVKISGFGEEGPYRDRPGFGTLAEAMSGFAAVNGHPDRGPLLPSFALADQATALLGAYATMVALFHRETSPEREGQYIDLPIYEALMIMLGNQVMEYDQLGIVPQRMGNRTGFSVPRNLYRTKEGKWVAISGTSPSIVERIFKAIGREDLIFAPEFKDNRARLQNADALDAIISEWMANHTQEEAIDRFLECEATIAGPPPSIVERILKASGGEDLSCAPELKYTRSRLQNADALDAIISEWMANHTQEEAIDRFLECEATIAPVYDVSDIMKDPHFCARGNIARVPDPDFGSVRMLNVAPNLSRTPGRIEHTGLEKGAANEEVYGGLGLSPDDVRTLRENGVV